MSSKNKSELILLSTLIRKLEEKIYYRVFAKTYVISSYLNESIIPDKEYVKEMFFIFIKENELQIYFNGSVVSLDFIASEIHRRASIKNANKEDEVFAVELEEKQIWENDVYIKVQDLKKLYANKCIVFPNSLLANNDKTNNASLTKN